MEGCPPIPGDYCPDPGNNGHYGGMGGGPCGQNTSLNCPPGMGALHVGVNSKQQTEIYPWMKESRQNNKRQNVTGKIPRPSFIRFLLLLFVLFVFSCFVFHCHVHTPIIPIIEELTAEHAFVRWSVWFLLVWGVRGGGFGYYCGRLCGAV